MAAAEVTQLQREASCQNRFEFGRNWHKFLTILDEGRIREAERSLCEMLECESLEGQSFLDLGSGSGLFSLAAFRLGASRVHSLDVDPTSVACTEELRSRYAPEAPNWQVEHASVLDRRHMHTLGAFDIVYSWGVLHHTGDLDTALEHVAIPVGAAGRLFIAIYNDRGSRTRRWLSVKRLYNRLPPFLRAPFVGLVMAPFELRAAIAATLRLRPQVYFRMWSEHRRKRGMSRWHDWVDWVGGYPFEVATPEQIFDFYRARGFNLSRLVTREGQNEFVFQRVAAARGPSVPSDV